MKKFQTRGWHIYLVEIFDNAGWLAYITKEAVLNEDLTNRSQGSGCDEDEPIEPQFCIPKTKLFS